MGYPFRWSIMDQPGHHILLRGNQPAAADRMRELLARTVQDQFADQRSNAGALDDSRQRMEGLEWLVKEVRELAQRTGQLDKELSAVKGRAEMSFGALAAKVDQSAETTTRQLTQSMAAMTATVDGLSDNVVGVGSQVDVLGGQVQAVHGRIERLDERLADTDDKLGSVHARLTSADDKLGALDTRLTAADGKIGSTDARVAALDARLERLDERLDDQYDRVSAIDHTLGATDTMLGAIGKGGGRI
jgi:chromosome segregation ATPase